MKTLKSWSATLAIIVALAAVAIIVITTFKLSIYTVETGSMTPDYPVGTRVIDTSLGGYKVNDAITFVKDGEVVTHYYLGKNPDGSLITRGKANPSIDHPDHSVMSADVKGRVLFQFPLLAPAFWRSPIGLGIIGLIVVMAIAKFWPKKPESVVEKESERQEAAV